MIKKIRFSEVKVQLSNYIKNNESSFGDSFDMITCFIANNAKFVTIKSSFFFEKKYQKVNKNIKIDHQDFSRRKVS